MPPHFPLASDKARHVGDGVAVVVAETRALAEDAAELVEVEYEPLPAVVDVEQALATRRRRSSTTTSARTSATSGSSRRARSTRRSRPPTSR